MANLTLTMNRILGPLLTLQDKVKKLETLKFRGKIEQMGETYTLPQAKLNAINTSLAAEEAKIRAIAEFLNVSVVEEDFKENTP